MNDRTSLLAGGAALAALLAAPLPAHAQDGCVPYRDVRQIHMTDEMSAVVTTGRGNHRITFRNICQVEAQGEYFVLDRFQLGQCVSPGDTFHASGTSAPCTVETIVPLRDLIETGGE